MKSNSKLFKTTALGIIALSALTFSCTNQDQESSGNDSSTSQIEESASLSSSLTSVCETRTTTFGKGDVNTGVSANVDDRSCVHDYTQEKIGTKTYGVYKLTAGTSSDQRETRIERNTTKARKKHGNFAQIKGTCRIRRVGTGDSKVNTDVTDRDGTYFIQAKGGDNIAPDGDPVVALFIAKEKFVNKVRHFEIFREEIVVRRGNIPTGRKLYGPITMVKEDTDFRVELTTGFFQDGKKPISHYVNAKINGVVANFQVPNPELAIDCYLRMGTYRCKGGTAEVLWGSDLTSSVNNGRP